MQRLRAATLIVGSAMVTLTLASCRRDDPTALDRTTQPIESTAGIPSSESDMRGRMERLTRAVALALADPQVRTSVYEDLRASRFREHKLHFAQFALATDSRFSPALTRAAGFPQRAVSAAAPAMICAVFACRTTNRRHHRCGWPCFSE